MGYAVAEAAKARGAAVVLVTGPSALTPPSGVEVQRVRSAVEMRDAVMSRFDGVDAVVMSAAVADYRPETVAPEKIKKRAEDLTIRLVKNPDILAELGARRSGARPVLVGFAVETQDLVGYAREKLARKRCDLIVANLAADGFEGDENVVTLVSSDAADPLPRMAKRDVAARIVEALAARLR
jgi:phosphopantothenoylcysteine decarboxylase/phosphopantothenate--cysteine ligase